MTTASAAAIREDLAFAMNLRDLGGKRAAGGLSTRRGCVVRAGNLARVDAAGARALVDRLGLVGYCDLRVADEIAREGRPEALIAAGVAWRWMPVDPFQPAFDRLDRPSIADWSEHYVDLLDRHRGTYAGLVREAAGARGALLFACSAGKDRTGIGAAVILSCLGVDEGEIVADYARTTAELAPHVDRFAHYFSELRPRDAFVAHYLTASAEILAGFLAEARRRWGGVEPALREAGLEPEAVEALRSRCLVGGDEISSA